MEMVRLGRTNLLVSRIAMGCIPIQRLSMDDAVDLLRRAYDNGVNFFDTAYVYTDSETKIGQAFAGGRRDKIIIASKTMSDDYGKTMQQLDESLRRLRTDHIDLYQWHNPANIENFLDERGPYQAMLDAKKAGKIRFIGITQHHLDRAHAAIASDAFDTMQFPLSMLSSQAELDMAQLCADRGMGVIAMKAMCGGMLDDGALPFLFLHQFPHIVPIWGLEKPFELHQFLALAKDPRPLSDTDRNRIEIVRAELGDEFCRGCGYCLPCPAGINVPLMMRMVFFVKRNAEGSQFNPARLAEVAKIEDCIHCRHCVDHCPYHLDAPEILPKQKAGFMELYDEYRARAR